MVNILEGGSYIEIGIVGNEGMIGTPIILASDTSPYHTIVQIADGALRMSAKILIEQMESAANRYHTIEERLARWLLQTQDRMKKDRLDLTQEFLSVMLGSRRAGVNLAAGVLQRAGLIRYKRRVIEVFDHEGLEGASCECYEVARKDYGQLPGGI